jgi:hypothetical protein
MIPGPKKRSLTLSIESHLPPVLFFFFFLAVAGLCVFFGAPPARTDWRPVGNFFLALDGVGETSLRATSMATVQPVRRV